MIKNIILKQTRVIIVSKETFSITIKMIIISTILVTNLSCENDKFFYRPNLPERLCTIGIIDIDDTTSYMKFFPEFEDDSNSVKSISFEKSFQSEYLEERTDSLADFSFSITTMNDTIFDYSSQGALRNYLKIKIPGNIHFIEGNQYYLKGKEATCPEIFSKSILPTKPPNPILVSVTKEKRSLSPTEEAWGYFSEGVDSVKSVAVRITFSNNKSKHFYCLIVNSEYYGLGYIGNPFSGFLNYSVSESNTPGFFAPVHGLRVLRYLNPDDIPDYIPGDETTKYICPVSAYFFKGDDIPSNECDIKIKTEFHGPWSNRVSSNVHDNEEFYSIRIKLLSIPESLYNFEKELYTYDKIKLDPFSEPVFIKGNIEGGNGVFALCRSSELIINFSPLY